MSEMKDFDGELSGFFDLLQIEDSTYRSASYLMFLLSKQFNEEFSIKQVVTQQLGSRVVESNYVILELNHRHNTRLRKYCVLRLDSIFYIPNHLLTYPGYVHDVKGGTIHISHNTSMDCFIFDTELRITTTLWIRQDVDDNVVLSKSRFEQYLIEVVSLYLDTRRNNNIQYRHTIALRDHDKEPTIYVFSINQLTKEGVENSVTMNITPEEFVRTIPEKAIRRRAYDIILQFVDNNITQEEEIEFLLQSEDSVDDVSNSDLETESEQEVDQKSESSRGENDRKTSIGPSYIPEKSEDTKIFNF
jgi:hypothetical protein